MLINIAIIAAARDLLALSAVETPVRAVIQFAGIRVAFPAIVPSATQQWVIWLSNVYYWPDENERTFFAVVINAAQWRWRATRVKVRTHATDSLGPHIANRLHVYVRRIVARLKISK